MLATLGLVLGAGCSAVTQDSPDAQTSPSTTVSPSPTQRSTPRIRQARNPQYTPEEQPFSDHRQSGAVELGQGEYTVFTFRNEEPVELQYAFEVVEGGPIDAFVMNADAFEGYQASERIGLSAETTVQGSTGESISGRLPAGEHVLVFDNTPYGNTTPAGTVRLLYGISLGSPTTPTPTPGVRQAPDATFSPDENPYEDYSRSGGLELARGEYMPFFFETERDVRLEYAFDVLEGGAVDVLAMNQSSFETYTGGSGRITFFANASVENSTADEVGGRLPSGQNVLVFDNTRLGSVQPTGTVRLQYGLNLVF